MNSTSSGVKLDIDIDFILWGGFIPLLTKEKAYVATLFFLAKQIFYTNLPGFRNGAWTRFFIYLQHPGALGAHKRPDSHVDVCWTPLVTVEALLVLLAGGLDVPYGQGELVILFALSDCCLRHLCVVVLQT